VWFARREGQSTDQGDLANPASLFRDGSGHRIAIAAYLGKSDRFDQAIAEFAAAYSDRNERDHQALVQSIADGKITAVAGV
jgi:hypothetical protein